MATVLLVEDNPKLNEINRRALEGAGNLVLTALTLEEARERLMFASPDVILLDVLLPDGNGIDFCGEIRDKTDAHILFLTSRGEDEDKLRGLITGGDDYITKPYKLEELLARVQSALRRRNMTAINPPAQTITRGPLTLDLTALRAYMNGEDMSLTGKEFSLLSLFVQNEGKTLTKEYLYETAWNRPMSGDAGAVWVQLSRLKSKLEAGSGGKISIAGYRNEGYALEIE